MRNKYSFFLMAVAGCFFSMKVSAQLITGNMFLQGKFLEVGSMANGSLGSSVAAPAGYHPHNSGSVFLCSTSSASLLASVYDWGHDGWAVGTPPYMGDYTLPGSPWEGWGIEVGGVTSYAYSTSCGFTGGTLTGSWSSYSNTGGRALGYWSGTAAGGNLQIKQEYRVDTLSSSLVVTVKLKNVGATTLNNIYYYRSCDPDNSETWTTPSTGSFSTNNIINFQGDAFNRHMVTASAQWSGTGPAVPFSLGTKDCRAKVFIYSSWPMSTSTDLAALWAGTASVGTSQYNVNTADNGDIAIGIDFKLGNLPPGDSTFCAYAYIYSGTAGLDTAFPNPQMVINGVAHDSTDTITACYSVGTDTIPVNLVHGDDKSWTWSHWTWAPATGLSTTTGVNNAIHMGALSGVTVYTITGYDTSSCSNKTFLLTVNLTPRPPGPTVTPQGYCQFAVASPASATGTALTWYDGTSAAGSSVAPTPSTALPGNVTYWVTQNVGGCTSDSSIDVIHITPQPVSPTVHDTAYCQGATPVQLWAIGDSLRWYTTMGSSPSLVAPTPSTAAAGVTTWYLTQTLNGCTSTTASIAVTVNPIPAAPVPVLQRYCQFDLASAVSAIGSNLTWYSGGPTGVTSAPTPSTATPGVTNYYVTQTLLGCVSDSAIDPVAVIAKPSAPIVQDTTYCQYTTAPALTAIGDSLRWYVSPSSAPSFVAPVPPTTAVGTNTWYVNQTINGCTSNQAPISVTTLFLPNFTIVAGKNFVCQYDTLSMRYNGPAMIDPAYMWILPAGSTIVSGTSTSPAIVVRVDSLSNADFTLTASDYSGRCTTSQTLQTNVIPQPTVNVLNSQQVCVGDTTQVALSDRSVNASDFTWNFAGGNIITENSNTGGPYMISWNTPGVHIVTVTPHTIQGCMGTTYFDTVNVHPYPNAQFNYHTSSQELCLEDSVEFIALDSSIYENSYAWFPEHFFSNNNRNHIWGKVEIGGYVKLVVSDPFGCTASDSVLLTPESCCAISMPTGFSPNNDGKNDHFRPLYDGYHRFHSFRITNRWGQTVFESTNNKMEWDGTYNGVPQDLGVYYYYVKYDCGGKTVEKKGEVTLVR